MNLLLPSIIALIGPLTELDAQEEELPTASDTQELPNPGIPDPELPDMVEWARAFVEHWPEARYSILRGDRKIGTYIQRNQINQIRDSETIVFSDEVKMKNSDGYRVQSSHHFSTADMLWIFCSRSASVCGKVRRSIPAKSYS